METKKCCVCKIIKRKSDFYKQKKKPDGLRAMCKECVKKYSNEHYQKILPRLYDWRRKNRYQRYCVSVKGRGFLPLPKDEWQEVVQKDCYYCGEENTTKGIDRVDNAIGYIKSNCISCCFFCNRAKSDVSIDYFLNKVKQIYEKAVSHSALGFKQ